MLGQRAPGWRRPERATGDRDRREPGPGRTNGPACARGPARYRARVTASAAFRPQPTALRAPVARRALVHGLVIGGLAFLVYTFAVAAPRTGTVGFDAFAYWNVQLPDPYVIPVGSLGAFTYSPPVANASACDVVSFVLSGTVNVSGAVWVRGTMMGPLTPTSP